MIIIGITGTLGAGKGTIVDYLVEKYGFLHFSGRRLITEEVVRRRLEVNRDTMTLVSNDLRKINGPGFVAEKLYEEARAKGENSIIESIRTIGEIESLKSKGVFYLFAVDADQKLRFNRISSRKSETDNVTFEKFQEDERREMESNDPNKHNLSACIKRADFVFINNETKEELLKKVDEVMKKITN